MPRSRVSVARRSSRAADAAPPSGEAAPENALRADARRNRARVLAAAKACFAERGAEASMEDVARRAGVGVGTLYRAFGSRAQLAGAVFRDMADDLAGEATRLAGGGDPWQALAAWLAAYVGLLREKRALWSALQPLVDGDPALLDGARQRAVGVVDALLRPAQAAGSVRADLRAADLLQLVNGAIGPATADPARAELLLGVILDGIRTRPRDLRSLG